MCGIVGKIGAQKAFTDELDRLRHRGPDNQGQECIDICGKHVLLGHTRLSILDLSTAGHQPMSSSDGRWWLTYNGEIYNHYKLRNLLSTNFRGHSDTETLIELIAMQGVEKTLPLLNGMFAFAALDVHECKLYLVRDPFGIKPLYYTRNKRGFQFSSELRALGHSSESLGDLNSEAMQLFLTLRYTPAPYTLWKNIQRLAPGHLLCLDVATGDTKVSRYVKPVMDRFSGSLDDAIEAYHVHLRGAVERQLLSDVPVGILLSGGIDSALVAAMAKECGVCLPAYTVGFGSGHFECEIDDAKETAKVLGLPFYAIETTPEQMWNALSEIVLSVEEPLGTTSIMPMWHLVNRTRADVSVVLTGQGNDEPWGGYKRYQVEMVRRIFPFHTIWGIAAKVVNGVCLPPEVLERGLRSLAVADLGQRTVEACALFSAKDRILLTGNGSDGNSLRVINNWLRWLSKCPCESVEKMMRLDARMNLADDLLLYGDKISMAVAIEARVPMLDIELVKFVESLPLNYRIALQRTKIVHKKMAERYLPSAIVHRPKKGFQVPFKAWSCGIWRERIEMILFDEDAPHWTLLRFDGVKKLWEQHLQGKPDRSRQFFALLMLALWWKKQ